MFNFRLEQPVSFRNDLPNKMNLDNISFSKNKLFTKYLTVPFQLNFKSDPKSNKSFYPLYKFRIQTVLWVKHTYCKLPIYQ